MTALTKMRRGCVALVLVSGLAACGEEEFANEPSPPTGIELTGVIEQSRVSVSPDGNRKRVGAGPVLITLSNQTDDSRTITLEGDSVRETVGPIQPRDTATIQKSLSPGTYEVKAGSPRATTAEIRPAELRIRGKRRSGSDQVLLP